MYLGVYVEGRQAGMYIFNNYIALNMLGPMRTLGKKKKKNKPKWKKEERKDKKSASTQGVSLMERKWEAAVRRQVCGVTRLYRRNRHQDQAERKGVKVTAGKEKTIWNSFLPFFSHFIYLSTTHTQTQLIRTEHKRRAFSHDEHQ